MRVAFRWISCVALLAFLAAPAGAADNDTGLWVLDPLRRPDVPKHVTASPNPIDAFIAADYHAKKLKPVGPADKRSLLRRVYLDLVGLPPTPAEQAAFLADSSPDAYEKVVDRLLDSPQHGVRYARHWLDVLRYADVDEHMFAAPGIYLWRDWVIHALNDDLPYDQFVRAQLTGYRSTVRVTINPSGFRKPAEPEPEDMFALGLLARGEVQRDPKVTQQLALTAVETVSSAFMGLTVACAKCHDHMYDPIKQSDFYAMKALFDPLVLEKQTLATPAELFAQGKLIDAADKRCAAAAGGRRESSSNRIGRSFTTPGWPFCRPKRGPPSSSRIKIARRRSGSWPPIIIPCCESIRTRSWRSCPTPSGRSTTVSTASWTTPTPPDGIWCCRRFGR